MSRAPRLRAVGAIYDGRRKELSVCTDSWWGVSVATPVSWGAYTRAQPQWMQWEWCVWRHVPATVAEVREEDGVLDLRHAMVGAKLVARPVVIRQHPQVVRTALTIPVRPVLRDVLLYLLQVPASRRSEVSACLSADPYASRRTDATSGSCPQTRPQLLGRSSRPSLHRSIRVAVVCVCVCVCVCVYVAVAG